MQRRSVQIAVIVVLAAALTFVAYQLGSAKRPAATTTPTAAASVNPSAAASSAAWPTADVSIDSVLKSGTAILIAVRTGAHPEDGYDRVAFDFRGQAPGVKARYVSKVVQDGSGAEVTLPGSAYLQLTFGPAAAHDDAGAPSSGVPRTIQTTDSSDFTGLKSYIVNGDFEGVVSVAIGQSSKAGFKIDRQDHGGVSTLYIDVPRP